MMTDAVLASPAQRGQRTKKERVDLRITLFRVIAYTILSAAGWLMVMWPIMALVRACLAAAGE
jgi:hypothetical protein